ncbi:MAG: hypothetical protein WC530_03510 [Candidatus Omnitrophota bacterium]
MKEIRYFIPLVAESCRFSGGGWHGCCGGMPPKSGGATAALRPKRRVVSEGRTIKPWDSMFFGSLLQEPLDFRAGK